MHKGKTKGSGLMGQTTPLNWSRIEYASRESLIAWIWKSVTDEPTYRQTDIQTDICIELRYALCATNNVKALPCAFDQRLKYFFCTVHRQFSYHCSPSFNLLRTAPPTSWSRRPGCRRCRRRRWRAGWRRPSRRWCSARVSRSRNRCPRYQWWLAGFPGRKSLVEQTSRVNSGISAVYDEYHSEGVVTKSLIYLKRLKSSWWSPIELL